MSLFALLSVGESWLLSPSVPSCFLAEQKPHEGLEDLGSDATQHPFNYGLNRAGNAGLTVVSGPALTPLWHKVVCFVLIHMPG